MAAGNLSYGEVSTEESLVVGFDCLWLSGDRPAGSDCLWLSGDRSAQASTGGFCGSADRRSF